MDLSLTTCLLCLLTTILCFFILPTKRNPTPPSTKLPPGPPRLPIIGNLHNLIGDQPHKSLARLASTHGPLMTLKLGQVTTIVASSPAAAREILQIHDQALSGRQLNLVFGVHDHHEFAISLLPVGPKWRSLRRVCNSHLFSPKKLDSNKGLRMKAVRECLEDVRRNASKGNGVDIGRAAFRMSFKALSATVLSTDLTEERSTAFKEDALRIMEEAGTPNLGDYFPVLSGVDLQGIRRRTTKHFGQILDLFGKIIEERLTKQKSEGYVSTNDMLDTLLDVDGEGAMDVDSISHLLLELFVAGNDTTSSTLEWAMAELLRNPTAFAKAREELNRTVDKGNNVEESDIPRLPYLQAILKETLRLHPPAPLMIPRKAGSEVEIGGLTVPKGAQVLVNLWAIGRDPSVWDDPNAFVPERFVGSEIDIRGGSFELTPFGAGRRMCPGLPLAMRMLHVILGSLVHWFDWRVEDGVNGRSLDMGEKFGLTLQKAQPLVAIPMPV